MKRLLMFWSVEWRRVIFAITAAVFRNINEKPPNFVSKGFVSLSRIVLPPRAKRPKMGHSAFDFEGVWGSLLMRTHSG